MTDPAGGKPRRVRHGGDRAARVPQRALALRRTLAQPHVLALLAIVAGAALVRFVTLDLQSFRHDEAVTAIRVLHPSLGETLDQVADAERSGPLYYVLIWLWSKLFGLGEVGLRSFSALVGTLTVPVVYLAGAELASRRAGLYAAALVALSPYLLWFAQDARSYSLFVLLGALSLLFMARALKRPTGRELAWWAAACGAALATHYFALFVVVGEALVLLRRLGWRRALAPVAAVALIGLMLLPLVLYQSEGERRDVFAEDSLAQRLVDTGVQFVLGEEATNLTAIAGLERAGLALGFAAAVLGLAGLLLLVIRGGREERGGGLLAVALGLFALAAPFVLAVAGVDLVNPRNLIVALPFLLVAAGAGFGALRSGWMGPTAGVAMGAVFAGGLVALLTTPSLQRPDWRAAAESIGPPSGARLVVAPAFGDDPLLAYLDGGAEKIANFIAGSRQVAQRRKVPVSEVVVVSALEQPPTLGRRFTLTGTHTTGELHVYEFAALGRRRTGFTEAEGRRLVGGDFTVLLQRERGATRVAPAG